MELGDDVRRMCEKFYHVLTFPPSTQFLFTLKRERFIPSFSFLSKPEVVERTKVCLRGGGKGRGSH